MPRTRKQMIRDMLFEQQGGKCYWCGRTCRQPRKGVSCHDPDIATYDHVHPKCKGGDVSIGNGVMACHRCNVTRGCRLVHPVTNKKFRVDDLLHTGQCLSSRLNREFVGGPIKVKNLIKLLMARDKESFVQFGTVGGISDVVLGVTGASPGEPVVIEVQ